MSPSEINTLAQQLINAFRDQTDANINLLGVQRRNQFEGITNRAASRGTLYSTGGRAQQLRYEGTNYLPAVTQQQSQQQQKEITIRGDLLDVQRKVDAQRRAAQELNNITFDALLD